MIEDKVITAEFFATLKDGEIVTLGEAYPPHELLDCQIELTKQEYNLLRAIEGNVNDAWLTLRSIRNKIEENGS